VYQHLASSLLLLFVLVRIVAAQSISAALAGLVQDSQLLVIQGAAVTVTNKQTSTVLRLRSDSFGRFRATSIPPGEYAVEISAPGFSTLTFESVQVTVGETRELRATLEPAATRQEITVTADAVSGVALDVGGEGASYGADLMIDLPRLSGTTGRNFRTLAYLTPGVAVANEDSHLPFSVSGGRSRNNNILIDSNDFNDFDTGQMMGRGASEQMVPSESIAGLQVLTHNFKAEYGRQSGSIMSMVSKAGTNEWHGTLYEYLRHDKLAARNTFDLRKAPLKLNQFGFSAGGPIQRDRAFLFGNYESFIRRTSEGRNIQTLTLQQRAQAMPAMRALADLYPVPNVAGTNLVRTNVAVPSGFHTFLVRADYDLSPSQRLFSRTTFLTYNNPVFTGAALSKMDTNHGSQGHSLHHVWTASPRVVNEARFNFTRFLILHNYVDPVLFGNPAVNGEVGSVQTPGLSPLEHPIWGGQIRYQNNFQWTDDLSIHRGRHAFKSGLAIRRLQSNNGTINNSFFGQLRFLNIADFLAGTPQSYSRNIGNPYVGLRATEYNAYLQDDWRVHPRLTLNLGLRYELNTVPLEVNGLIRDEYRFPGDHNNFAPRFGFAWQADREARTVVRGGYGIYYNVLELVFVGGTRFNPPLITTVTAANPTFPDLLSAARASGTSGRVLPDPELRNPYAQHFNLTVERQLWSPRAVLSAGYVGTLAIANPRNALPNGGIALSQAQRPDGSLGFVNRLETTANSRYDSLQASVMWRRSDLTLLFAYTFSKLLDEVSDYSTSNGFIDRNLLALEENNRRLDRGRSDLDLPQVAKVGYSYDLPFLRQNAWLGGWQVQGITSLQSGRTYTLYSGSLNRFGTSNNRILHIPGSLSNHGAGSRRTFSLAPGYTTQQLSPAFGTLGTIGRNTARGDRLAQFDFSLFKTITVTERWKLQFRAEAFNLFNTVNYITPDNTLSSPNFGQYLLANPPREAQLALRLSF
jgi:hypothetical protein